MNFSRPDGMGAGRAADRLSRGRRLAPVLTLVLLAPVISEVLLGATRLSRLFVLIPEVLVWGVGALIIREVARRSGRGARSMLILGLALGIAEEFVIQQTSLAPLPWGGHGYSYGRVFGVNWVWLLAMLGFESVWVVLMPVQLTELLFRGRRDEPWLQRKGLVTSGVLFLLGCLVAWYGWTQRARPMIFHVPKYQPPPAAILLGAAAVLLLIAMALEIPARVREGAGSAPPPWFAGLAAFALAAGWNFLIAFAARGHTAIPWAAPMTAGIAWAGMAYFLVERWRGGSGWRDTHRLAVILGTIAATALSGWQGKWLPGDLMLRVVVSVAALFLVAGLMRRADRT